MNSLVLADVEVWNAGPKHDRRPSANLGYRVWNPFEVELRDFTDGRYDQVAQGFTVTSQIVK